MKKEVDEMIELLTLVRKVNDSTNMIGLTEDIRRNFKYGIANLELPIFLEEVLDMDIECYDEGNPSLDSAVWVIRFIMKYFNTNTVLGFDEIEKVYEKMEYPPFNVKALEAYITDCVDILTGRNNNLLYSADTGDNFWLELEEAICYEQLVILRLNDEFVIVAGATKEKILLRTRTGKIKMSYKKIENCIQSIISVYSDMIWKLRGGEKMNNGLIYVQSYNVEYKILIPTEKKYIPKDINDIVEHFRNYSNCLSEFECFLYKNIADVLEFVLNNKNITLNDLYSDEGFVNIKLTFATRIALDQFENKFKNLLIH